MKKNSFNPCFYGSWSQTSSNPCSLRKQIKLFQSLFLWKLVLDSLQLTRLNEFDNSFNPCFYGSWSQTQGVMPCPFFQLKMFQSLFLWKLVLDGSKKLLRGILRLVFQSLFLWKLVLDLFFPNDCKRKIVSFNPCFYGSWSQTYLMSLSFHKLLLKRFNPCFYGSWSQTISHIPICTTTSNVFQSLFLWKLVLDRYVCTGLLPCWRVSILVFMEVGLRRHSQCL